MPDPVAATSALEAMNTALGGEGPSDEQTTEPAAATESVADVGAAVAPDIGTAGGPAAAADPATTGTDPLDAGGVDPELSARRAALAAEQPRDKGRFAPKKPDDPAAAAAAVDPSKPTPAAPAAAVVDPAKKPDPLSDPPPASMKEDTKVRFEEIRTIAKTEKAGREQAESDRELLLGSVRETGASAEQFTEALGLLRDINSTDVAANERAYQQLVGATNIMAQKLGKTPPGIDPLAGQSDLIAAVNGGQMTRQIAETVAASRREAAALRQRQADHDARQQATSQSQQALQAARTEGTTAVQRLEAELKRDDPAFAGKQTAIMADTGFRTAMQAAHPSQWASMLAIRYAKQFAPAPAAAAVLPAGGPGQQPLRGNKAPAGGTARVPTSALDAMNAALG